MHVDLLKAPLHALVSEQLARHMANQHDAVRMILVKILRHRDIPYLTATELTSVGRAHYIG